MRFSKSKKPESYFYIAIISNHKERFIKVGEDSFKELTYMSFKSQGYKVAEVKVLQFTCSKDAKKAIDIFARQYADFTWLPLPNFKESDSCYNIELLDRIEIPLQQEAIKPQVLAAKSYTPEIGSIESEVMKALVSGVKQSEIARQLDIKPYQVTRIKQKYNGK